MKENETREKEGRLFSKSCCFINCFKSNIIDVDNATADTTTRSVRSSTQQMQPPLDKFQTMQNPALTNNTQDAGDVINNSQLDVGKPQANRAMSNPHIKIQDNELQFSRNEICNKPC